MIFVNTFLLLVWLRILPQKPETFFNPYVAGGMSLLNRLYRFINAAAWKIPEIFIAAVILLFALFFRGVTMSFLGRPWSEHIGLWQFSPIGMGPGSCVLFSFVSFAWLLLRLWTLESALSLLNKRYRAGRISQALSALAMPVSAVPGWQRAVFVFAFGMLLGIMLFHTSSVQPAVIEGWPVATFTTNPLSLAVFSLAAIAETVSTAAQLVMYLIIASFAGILMRAATLANMAREGLDLIIGSVVRKKLIFASMDFTPVVFYIAATFVYPILLGIIRLLYNWTLTI